MEKSKYSDFDNYTLLCDNSKGFKLGYEYFLKLHLLLNRDVNIFCASALVIFFWYTLFSCVTTSLEFEEFAI